MSKKESEELNELSKKYEFYLEHLKEKLKIYNEKIVDRTLKQI